MIDNPRLVLEVQISNLYDVFRGYTVQHPLGGANSYVYKEIQEALASTPIRLLKGEHLDRLTFSSMNTWSTTEEFKHFLPRILELLAFDAHSFSMASGSLIISKFTYSDFANAPETEIEMQSVRAYLRALWDYILEVYPSRSIEAWDFVENIHHVDAINVYLDVWQSRLSEQAAQYHLADFVSYEFNILRSGDGILRNKPEALLKWLAHPDRQVVLERAFFGCTDEWFVEIISQSVENLKLLASYL